MNKNLKVMIAYDGSAYSETAIADLQLAGMPREGGAIIVSVRDSLPPRSLSTIDSVGNSLNSARILSTAALLQNSVSETLENLKTIVGGAVENLGLYLPEWEIEGKTLVGDPISVLLKEAAFQKPDLVVVGSHQRSAFGRFFLGSVSIKLASRLNCAVRVGRGTAMEKLNIYPRLIAEIDDSPETEKVIRHIGNRVWSDETQVRLVLVENKFDSNKNSEVLSKQKLRLEWAIEQLEAIGLNISVEFIKGDPQISLLETARRWEANSIFVPAKKFGQSTTDGLDDTTEKIVNEAHCSIEIVR